MKTQRIRGRKGHARLVEVRNATIPDDSVTVEDHLAWLGSARAYAAFLALDGELAVGAAAAVVEPTREIPYVHFWVDPAHRRRGAGSALYEAVSAWSAEHGYERIEVPVQDDDRESLAFAEHRGFVEDRREDGLVLELSAIEPPEVEPPPGVEIVTWAERPELARGIHEVVLEALPDIPGEEDYAVEPFEDWLEHDMRQPGDRPDATFVAVAGDEVAGYSKLAFTGAQPTTAHHDLTAVKRAWRGRGIARALKAAQIRWALENGYEQLRTRNEVRNEPIRRLNERLGYRGAPGRIYLRGPLA